MTIAQLQQAARVLRAGGVVAYPTESCYGLGCDPRNPQAVRRLLRCKHRPAHLGLILIAARFEQLLPFLAPVDAHALAKVRASWPGPFTWLLPAHPRVSCLLRGTHATIAVRVTAHPVAAALCRHARSPVVSTSANRHGRAPARSAAGVLREFGADVDYVLPGRIGAQARPSEILDALSGAVIRAA